MQSPVLHLREVVEDDPDHGRSSTEITKLHANWIDYCCLPNDRAWSELYYAGHRYMYVKDSPDDVLDRFNKAMVDLVNQDISVLLDYPNLKENPPFLVYQDNEKSVLINLTRVKAIRSIAKSKTRFTFSRGYITINLPMEWLNVPQDKVKPSLRRSSI